MREKTSVGDVRYGFGFFSPDASISSGTRQTDLWHHITCNEEPLATTKHLLH
jgi:hypothetical protein